MITALVHEEYGPPEQVLRLVERDEPTCGGGEVVVRVRAVGVNWADRALTLGEPYVIRPVYGLRRPRNPVRGSNIAGDVVAVGPGVQRLSRGDAVFGWCEGAFAEQVRAAETTLLAKPAALSYEQAAAAPEAGMVALQALRDVARLQPGQQLLVNGASGGIGTFAVQIGKALGAEVTGVCSAANRDLVASLGADHVLDYARDDFTRGHTAYDAILDIADRHTLRARRRVLTRRGTLIPNSGEGGRWLGSLPRIAAAWTLSAFVPQRLRPFYSAPRLDDLAALVALVEAGSVTPVVGATYALDDAPAAVAAMGGRHAPGKLVVTV